MTQATSNLVVLMLLLPVVLAVAAAPVAAQAGNAPVNQPTANGTATTAPADGAATTTPEPAAGGSPSEVELVVDEHVSLVDYSHASGVMTLEFYADEFTSVYVTPMPEASESTGRVQSGRAHVVDKGTVTTVRVEAPNGVSMTTDELSPGFAWVQKPSSGLVSGPYTGKDVRDVGIGASVAVAVAVLFTAVKAKVSGGEEAEQVA